jgi:glycosyltransferase involved in cell wall biosynthesis
MLEGVSVIVCCYNSAKRLPETLKFLALQVVPATIPWEVIIINNASSDNTVQVAKEEWEKYHLDVSFRVVDQPKPGLSYARDKGFEIARYEYCLFCDDDNWLSKDYVRISFETISSDSLIAVLGGFGHAVCEINPPIWFKQYKKTYAVGPQAEQDGDITKVKGVIYGAGAVVKRSIYLGLKKAGFQSLLTDRRGEELSTGNDYEICYSMALLGYKIFYNPSLLFEHFIPKERLTMKYVEKVNCGVQAARPVLSIYRYKYQNPAVLSRRFFFIREILYSFLFEMKKLNLTFPYTFQLIKNYNLIHYTIRKMDFFDTVKLHKDLLRVNH